MCCIVGYRPSCLNFKPWNKDEDDVDVDDDDDDDDIRLNDAGL